MPAKKMISAVVPTAFCCRGFTLLELMIVMTIVSLLATLGGVSLSHLKQRSELTLATNHFYAFLHQVQVAANYHNQNLTVSWYQEAKSYCFVVTEEIAPSACQGPWQFHLGHPGLTVQTVGESHYFIFYGKRNVSKPASVVLSNGAGSTKLIIAKRGRIRRCAVGLHLTGIPLC